MSRTLDTCRDPKGEFEMHRAMARSDARANRKRLIDAAHEVFRDQGLDAEMKVIAERAGVGVGTIYRNFPTKDDLITAITAELVEGLEEACDAADRTEDPVEGLRILIAGCLRNVEQYGDVVMATKQRGVPAECINLIMDLNPHGRIVTILQRGIDSGRLRSDMDAEVAATLVESSLFPPGYKALRQAMTHQQVADAVTDLFLRGMLAG